MTTPYSAPAVDDESKLSADEYWAAHPELAAERHKHERAAAQAQAVAKAESEVERFLQTQLNYRPISNNKMLMLEYLESHNLPLTAGALFEAFQALKPQLAQSDKGLEFGSTRVIDLGERNQNPSYISTELRDDLRRKISRFSSQQYQDWLVRHPEEAAILDEG